MNDSDQEPCVAAVEDTREIAADWNTCATETATPHAKILIVDDQEFNLRVVESILQQGGYTCYRSLSDSRQAVSVYLDFQPDLILLDLMMPHLDGVAVMEQLRAFIVGTYLPVLVLTADLAAEAKRRPSVPGPRIS